MAAGALALAALHWACARRTAPSRPARSKCAPRARFRCNTLKRSAGTSRQHVLIAPYLDLSATAHLQPDLNTSVFVNGGHNELGSFRDSDNTFVSFGGTS